MQINKKFLQSIAVLWILLFHTWMNLFGGAWEQYVLRIGYIGVDLFFFVSAYSLAGAEIRYLPFVRRRFGQVYVKFALFVLLAAFYRSWPLGKILRILFGLDLFQNGGGSFLWFLPSILLFYLIYPFFLKWKNKYKVWIVLIAWFLISLAITKLTGYTKLLIFTNRLPVILLGYLFGKKRIPKWAGLSCLPVGLVLMYFFAFKSRLSWPFPELYLTLAALPAVGLATLSSYVKPSKVWEFLAAPSLEIYALQMIFGVDVMFNLYRWTGSVWLTDLMGILLFTVGISLLYEAGRLLGQKMWPLIADVSKKKTE